MSSWREPATDIDSYLDAQPTLVKATAEHPAYRAFADACLTSPHGDGMGAAPNRLTRPAAPSRLGAVEQPEAAPGVDAQRGAAHRPQQPAPASSTTPVRPRHRQQ